MWTGFVLLPQVKSGKKIVKESFEEKVLRGADVGASWWVEGRCCVSFALALSSSGRCLEPHTCVHSD